MKKVIIFLVVLFNCLTAISQTVGTKVIFTADDGKKYTGTIKEIQPGYKVKFDGVGVEQFLSKNQFEILASPDPASTNIKTGEQANNAGGSLQELQKLEANVGERFKIWDWNKDGIINNAEYKGWGTSAEDADVNKDGALTVAEYVNYHINRSNGKAVPGPSSTETKIGGQADNAAGSLQELQKLEANVGERFKIWDWNKDGIINNAEYKGWGTSAENADLNKDAALTIAEYVSYHSKKTQSNQAGSDTKASRQPPLGKYNCTGYGLNASGGQGGSYVYKGHFFLQAGNNYTANNTTGTVSIVTTNEKTTIIFKQGSYSNIVGEYKPDGDRPRFILTWPAATPGGSSSIQYCSLVK